MEPFAPASTGGVLLGLHHGASAYGTAGRMRPSAARVCTGRALPTQGFYRLVRGLKP